MCAYGLRSRLTWDQGPEAHLKVSRKQSLGHSSMQFPIFEQTPTRNIAQVLTSLVLGILLSVAYHGPAAAQELAGLKELAGFPPSEVRVWFRNPDGSCVQCSNSLVGIWHNCPQASTLLWNTQYGPAIRGGSWPSRVEEYCEKRQIPAWNITGDATFDWLKWCGHNGRMAAIGAGSAHFQAFVWHDHEKDLWYVNNNNSPEIIDVYTWPQFKRLHLASGAWIVVFNLPPPPAAPKFIAWWDDKS